jgi:hypothetical protein
VDDRLEKIFRLAHICAFDVISQAWHDFPGDGPYSVRKRENDLADADDLLRLMAEHKKEYGKDG